MGSPLTEDRGMYASLNNCAFVSTAPEEGIGNQEPFCFLMDASMLGVGVGFDTKGSDRIEIYQPLDPSAHFYYQIEDSREGWVESVRRILNVFL